MKDSNQYLNKVALKEFLVTAEICLKYKKDDNWDHKGALGFSALLLLLTYIECVGYLLHIKGTEQDKGEKTQGGLAFDKMIVKNNLFGKYNFNRDQREKIKKILYASYRSYVVHQAGITNNTTLSLNSPSDKIVDFINGNKVSILYLSSLYEVCVEHFNKNEDEIIKASEKGYIL